MFRKRVNSVNNDGKYIIIYAYTDETDLGFEKSDLYYRGFLIEYDKDGNEINFVESMDFEKAYINGLK